MSKEGKKKKGAAAAEDQGAPCDEKLWPVPEASSAAASRDVIDEVSVGESTHSDIHLVFSRSPPVECLNHDDIDAMDMQLTMHGTSYLLFSTKVSLTGEYFSSSAFF